MSPHTEGIGADRQNGQNPDRGLRGAVDALPHMVLHDGESGHSGVEPTFGESLTNVDVNTVPDVGKT